MILKNQVLGHFAAGLFYAKNCFENQVLKDFFLHKLNKETSKKK